MVADAASRHHPDSVVTPTTVMVDGCIAIDNMSVGRWEFSAPFTLNDCEFSHASPMRHRFDLLLCASTVLPVEFGQQKAPRLAERKALI